MEKLTIRDFDPQGKRVLMRVDFNVPIEDGRVRDDSRIRAALPSIVYLLEHGASIVLMSHLGRPKGKVTDSLRLRPVAQHLSDLIGRPVPATGDAIGLGTTDAVNRMKPGQLLLLENLRFHVGGRGQRSRVRRGSRDLRRRLRQRCLRHRAPRACQHRRRGRDPAGLRGPAHGARDPQPLAACSRTPASPSRPSSAGPRSPTRSRSSTRSSSASTSWSSAAAWPTPSWSRRATPSASPSSRRTASRTPSAS